MQINKIIDFVENKKIKMNENWYLHATRNDVEIVEKILIEGIKSACLRGLKGNHFNGKYYISLFKQNSSPDLHNFLKGKLKFVIANISPFYAQRQQFKLRHIFINTIIPFRTSEWDGEYQEFLKIDKSNIIALEYSLFDIVNGSDDIAKLYFLKEIILCLEKLNLDLPIYDFSSSCEINKEKVLTLDILNDFFICK